MPRRKSQSLKHAHPKVDVGQHILSPEKLQMFEDFDFDVDAYDKLQIASPQDIRHDDGDDVVDELRGRTRSSDDYLLSLPCPPPRRSPVKGFNSSKRDASTDSSTDSSLMPSFNTENAVNTFGIRRNQQSLPDTNAPESNPAAAISSEPPPRPPRSARRTPTATTVFRHSSPPPLNEDSGEERVGRASIGALSQASTARPLPEVLDARCDVHPTSPLDGTATFRNMKKVPRTVLTEKQKQDRWNDLLSKSDKAGGTVTLHVGSGGLLSDRIRDSQYSDC